MARAEGGAVERKRLAFVVSMSVPAEKSADEVLDDLLVNLDALSATDDDLAYWQDIKGHHR